MNKKGGFSDGIYYLIVIFVVAIVSIVGWKLMTVVNNDFQNNNQITSEGKTIMSSLNDRYVGVVDGAFLIVFIGIILAVVIGAYMIYSHPALFWLSIPIMGFIIFLGAIYGNVFDNFASSSEFASSASDFTFIKFIMGKFIYVITVIVLMVAFALFAKNQQMRER